jgi:hypothetical protein
VAKPKDTAGSAGAANKPAEPDADDKPRAWELESGTVRKEPARPDQFSLNPAAAEAPRAIDRVSAPDQQLHPRAQVMGFSRECAVSILDRYVIIVWRRELALAGVAWARKAFIHLRRAKPDGSIGVFMLANEACDVSANPQLRSELSSLLTTYGERIGGMAVAYEGAALRLSMLRGIVTAISMTSRTRTPIEVFSSASAAGWWLHGKVNAEQDGVPAEDLLQVAHHLSVK